MLQKNPKDIFSNLNQIVACMQGVYRGCNNNLLTALGFPSMDEMIGKTDYDVAKILGLDIGVIETFRKIDQEIVTSEIPRLNIEELPFHFGGGKIVNQLTNKVPLRDEDGHVVGVLGVSIDISYRKKQEADFLEQVFACMPGSVYWKDRDGVYQGCNDIAAHPLQLPKTELIGKTDYDLGKKLNWFKEIADWVVKVDQEIMSSGILRLTV